MRPTSRRPLFRGIVNLIAIRPDQQRTLAAVPRTPHPSWQAQGRTIVAAGDAIPKIMAIENLTPDSFSDGGRFSSLDDAVNRALELVAQGADLLDIGGESSRPGAEPVPLDEELRRAIPAIEAIASRVPVPISVDTTKAEVARKALAAGAVIVNDISALEADPAMRDVVAESRAGVVLMHMRGTPQTMHIGPRYNDVVTEVHDYLARRIEFAQAAGIPRDRIAIDPGIGFAKTNAHSLEILRNLHRFATLGCALLVGISRKGILGKITGRDLPDRATASAVSSLAACVAGANVVRVHDVGPMVDAIRVWTAVHGWEEPR
jgi:dihydropteroate synthase